MCPPSTPLTTEGEEDEDEEEDGEEEEDVVVMEEGERGPWWERGGVPVIWGGGGGFLHTILQVPESCEEWKGRGRGSVGVYILLHPSTSHSLPR